MSQEPLLPSYGAATQLPRSSEYRLVAKHTNAARALMNALFVFVSCVSAIFATIWASRSSGTKADPLHTPHPGTAPLLPYFASISLVVSTCFWIAYLVFIAHDKESGSVLKRKITIGVAIAGKAVLAAAHVAIWQAYKMWCGGLETPNWAVVFTAAQAWFDVVFVGIHGWVM